MSASIERGRTPGAFEVLFGAVQHKRVLAVVFGGAGAIVVTVLWAYLFPELAKARTFAPQHRQREPST